MRFAAFIMTYERPNILLETITKVFSQSYSPEKILIVDNSESFETQKIILNQNYSNVFYHRVGFNSGPAGAATIGLKILAEEGYDWIYWGDDDDPPTNFEIFENLINLAENVGNVGIIGSRGGTFNRHTGRTKNLTNIQLINGIEVDYVPGNKNMIVNSTVIKKGFYPSPSLFFGFEELDFCLKVKGGGYKVIIDHITWYNSRIESGRTDKKYRWKGKINILDERSAQRTYFSTRNMLFILHKNKYYTGLFFFLFKSFFKALYFLFYFRFKISRLFCANSKAIIHFLIGKSGNYKLH